MTAYYDFFRYVKLYSPDGTTLEQTIEADNVTDSINFIRGNGVAWNSVDLASDTFKFDVDYNLSVPLSTTAIRLTDVNNIASDITLVAGGNMIITRDNANQMTIAALVGGVSKSISNITAANPPVVTTTNAHAFTDGTEVTLVDVVGMTNVNGNEYFMDILTSNTFSLYSDAQLTTTIDGTGFSAYTSGGVATADYGGAKNAFKTIQVSGASPVVADNIQDILNLTGGTGIDITTTPGTDTIAWAIDSTVTTLVGSQTLTNKTLTSPIIAAIKPSASNSWALPDSNDTFVGKATTDTLTNKSVNLANNTLTTTIAQLNTAVSDESVVARDTTDTLTNKSISLTTNTVTGTLAEFNTAVSDETVVGRATTDTLTNKGIDLTNNTVTGTFAELNTAVSDATLVSIAGTETLTNKTLTDPILSPTATTGGKIEFLEGTNNGTNKATLIGPASTADVTITLPAATDTLVGKATTDTFTNKSGSNSQWTNDEAYITAATTDTLTNKSISLTTNTVTGTIAELNTAVSDETVVGRATTDTLTNKTLSAPAFSGTATTFTSTGIDDNATSTSITIDSSQNVGIGGTPIALSGNATPGLTLVSNGPFILLKDSNNANKTTYIANNSGVLQFGTVDDDGATNKTEHMQITDTGTVQVAAAADFVTPNISGSIKGMTFVMTIGDTTAIGDGGTTVTRYATPGNDWQSNLALGTSMPVTSNMKCVAMSVLSDGVLTAGSSNATLMKNGADTTTTVTFANGDGGTGDVKQSTVNNNFDAGNRVGIKVVTLAATARSYFVMTQWELL